LKKFRTMLDLKEMFSESIVDRGNSLDESTVTAVSQNSFKIFSTRFDIIGWSFDRHIVVA